MLIESKQVATSMNTASVAVRQKNAVQKKLDPFQEKQDYIENNTPSIKYKTATDIGVIMGLSGAAINKKLTEMGYQEPNTEKSHIVELDHVTLIENQARVINELGYCCAAYICHETGSKITKSIRWTKDVIKHIKIHMKESA